MSDELERPKRNDEAEVEAHHNWKKGAGVEAGDEADDGDDFEAHRHNKFA